jgi:hypothetical protein
VKLDLRNPAVNWHLVKAKNPVERELLKALNNGRELAEDRRIAVEAFRKALAGRKWS